MIVVDAALRRFVCERAANRCEYCRLPQKLAPLVQFHVEHVVAQQHVVDDSVDNLALACPDCNRHKGPNLTTLDPDSREILPLFHPRLDSWDEHFMMQGPRIMGRTAVGSATIRLLQMNATKRIELRKELLATGEF